MHEVSLCESILKIVERHSAKEEGVKSVLRVHIQLGDLSGASCEAMSFAFPLVAKGTVAEGAELVFHAQSGNILRVSAIDVV